MAHDGKEYNGSRRKKEYNGSRRKKKNIMVHDEKKE